MFAISAPHRRAADSTKVSRTGCRSKVERLMTLSTSAVAVCCCSDTRNSLSSHVCLDGDDGLLRKVGDQFDLLVSEGTHFLAINRNGANQRIVF